MRPRSPPPLPSQRRLPRIPSATIRLPYQRQLKLHRQRRRSLTTHRWIWLLRKTRLLLRRRRPSQRRPPPARQRPRRSRLRMLHLTTASQPWPSRSRPSRRQQMRQPRLRRQRPLRRRPLRPLRLRRKSRPSAGHRSTSRRTFRARKKRPRWSTRRTIRAPSRNAPMRVASCTAAGFRHARGWRCNSFNSNRPIPLRSLRPPLRHGRGRPQAGPVAIGGPSALPHSDQEPSYSAVSSTPSR